MRLLALTILFGALAFVAAARAGLTSTSYKTFVCHDVDNAIKANTEAIEAVSRKLERSTRRSERSRLERELFQVSQQSERNLEAAYASCERKAAAARAEQQAAAELAEKSAAARAGTSSTPDTVPSGGEKLEEEAPEVVTAYVSENPYSGSGSAEAPSSRRNSRGAVLNVVKPTRVGGATFAEVDVLPAFRESFADDPLVSPGAKKGAAVDPLFSLDQIAIHDGFQRSGGVRKGSSARGELPFRVYGAADRRANALPAPARGGTLTQGGQLAQGGQPARERQVSGASARELKSAVRAIASASSSAAPSVAGASVAEAPERQGPRWLKYLPKFIADRFFRAFYAATPQQRRKVAGERAQIAGMHTDIFYNVNRAYMIAGESLKK